MRFAAIGWISASFLSGLFLASGFAKQEKDSSAIANSSDGNRATAQQETRQKDENESSKTESTDKPEKERLNPALITTKMSLLRNERVRGELELLEYQVADLTQRQYDWQKEMGDIIRTHSAARSAERNEKLQDLFSRVEKQLSELLVENQLLRLRQLVNQQLASRASLTSLPNANLMLSEGVSQALGISLEQHKEILARAKALDSEIEQKVTQWREQAGQELFEMLSPEQRETFEQSVGEVFDFAGPVKEGERRSSADDH